LDADLGEAVADCQHDRLTAHVVTPVWAPARQQGATVVLAWEDAGYGDNQLRALTCDDCSTELDRTDLEVM
jgi:hypothetical protein